MTEVKLMRKHLFRKPKSQFIVVKCKKCGNLQLTFSHASIEVKCRVCGETLLKPTGGKAKLVNAEFVKAYE